MGIAGISALLLGPAHYRRCPGRPSLRRAFGARIELILQTQQTYMSQRLRTKTADLQIILKHRALIAQFVRPRCKELPLIFKTRSPGKNAANVQAFTLDLAEHVRG